MKVVLVCAAAAAFGFMQAFAGAYAQTTSYGLHEKGVERLNEARSVAPLSVDTVFGDSISNFNGGGEFSHVDIAISGNSELPVELRRVLKIVDRSRTNGQLLGGFGDWDLDVPRLSGVFAVSAGGWKPEGGTVAQRCSAPGAPAAVGAVAPEDYWAGYELSVPGSGTQTLLMNPSSMIPAAGSGPYPWITKDMWRISCKTSTANGYPGQAFIAHAPDGRKFHLDWGIERAHASIKDDGNGFLVPRVAVFFLVSRIEDRFGNTVDYTWSGDKLTGITSNDGRHIGLTWSANRITSVTSSVGPWSYGYVGTTLHQVTRPDSSKWTYASSGTMKMVPPSWTPPYEDPFGCPEGLTAGYTGNYSIRITAPSGAVGQFAFTPVQHWRSSVPDSCVVVSPSYFYLKIPRYNWSYSLMSKTVTGPGLPMMTWAYSWNPQGPVDADTKHTIVAGPNGTWTRYTYGTGFEINEGQLLKVEQGGGPGTILRTQTSAYVTNAQAAGQSFPAAVGTNPQAFADRQSTAWLRPQTRSVIKQQGVDFTWQVENTCAGKWCFNVFARPTEVRKHSTVAGSPSKTEIIEYAQNHALWILNQASKLTCKVSVPAHGACDNGPDSVITQTTYDPIWALPLVTRRFGKIEQSLGWNTTSIVASGQRGTVSTVADGNGNTMTLSDWMRGIPQFIRYPATPEAPQGATQLAAVNAAGWITSVTDENAYLTSYTHDAMGRLAGVVYPSGDRPWNTTTQIFEPVAVQEYGIGPGHWRQTVSTGNGRKTTYFDGLWRPVLTREYDAADELGTQRFQRFAYDHAGRTTFASYPAAMHNPTTGNWSEYDLLGRPASASQDSELGLLTTVTSYLPGFATLITSPLTSQTTTRFIAWDQPTVEFPVHVAHPEGAFTHITRDVFGKPTILRRSDDGNPVGGMLAVNRLYAYNDAQELCRAVEPETGATLMGYDAAGNLAWSAAGMPASQACEATGTSPAVAARRADRTYDARSRLKTLAFPDGNGNQAWDYYPDGKPRQITTWNIGFPGADPKETRNLYTYYQRGLLKTELIAVPSWYTFSVEHGYNANGHETSLTYPTGHAVTRIVNALGQPTAISGAGTTYASGITYHPNGAVASFAYGNNILHAMAPNDRQLPDSISVSHGGTQYMLDQYDYDGHGNVLAITDLRPGKAGRRSRTMGYDDLDRLTSVASPMFGSAGANYVYNVLDDLTQVRIGGAQARDQHYCYDANRRLTNVKAGGCGGGSIVGLGYDDQGNLANRNGQLYRFDYGNRLREVEGVERYRYDGHGRRVLAMQFAHGTVLSQYGLEGKLLYQKSDRTSLETDSIYLGSTLLATREWPYGGGASVVKYQHTDALGSPVVVTRQDRSIVEETEYEPYGQVLNRPMHDGPGYTGHVEDAATGLVYMQQRYYDPGVGLFLSVDPVTAYASPVSQFHRYRYANNNPYKFIDPDGRASCALGSVHCEFAISESGIRTSVRSPLDIGPNQQSGSPGSSSSGFTTANKESRLAAAEAEVSKMRGAVEGVTHASLNDAAAYFGQVLQPVISRYGFEIFADINPLAGNRLESVYVSEFADMQGIGIVGYVPYGGLPTIHGHAVISESPDGLAPLSPQDVSWFLSTRDNRHYVSDSTGVYKFNGVSAPPTRVGP